MGASALASKWCKSRCGETGLGLARLDEQGQAKIRHGLIDPSAEGFGPLRWVLRNPDLVCQVRDRKVTAEPVVVGLGLAGQPLQTAALGASAPSAALFGG